MVGWLSALLKGWPQLAFQFYVPLLPCLLINLFSLCNQRSWSIFYVPGTVLVLNKPGPLFSQPIGIMPPFKVKDHFHFLLYLLRCSQATGISPDSFVSSFSSVCTILSCSPQVILPGFCVLSHEWVYFLLQGWIAPCCFFLGLIAHRRCSVCVSVSKWSHGPTVPPFLTPALLSFCEAPPSTLLLRGLMLTVPTVWNTPVSVICITSSLTSFRSLLSVSSLKRTFLTTWCETPPLPTGLHSSLSLTTGCILCS